MVSLAITMTVIKMKAYTYIEKGRFELLDKPKPEILDPKDAIVYIPEMQEAELMYKLFDLVSGSLEEVNQFL